MKKKLLSLVLAGAMVASTSVSAFAATTPSTTSGTTEILEGTNSRDVEIGVEGNILDDQGNAVQGTIRLTVPTATTFSVNKDGVLSSADMTIRNEGDEQVTVVVSKFVDSNGAGDIEVIKKTEFERDNKAQNEVERNKIWLRLTGASQDVSFGSVNKGEVYSIENNGDDSSDSVTNSEIGTIDAESNMTLRLVGKGGTKGTASSAIQDNFRLILKVKRTRA